jgi:death on curing protein
VKEWRWLSNDVILAIHDEQLTEHGGRPVIREMGLLESALTRPINRANYARATVFDLAAAYAFGIVRDHPFIDGNKRVAFVTAALFLIEHGIEITASDEAIVTSMLALADDSIDEAAFSNWLRVNSKMTGAGSCLWAR